jgi:hypothetical protein
VDDFLSEALTMLVHGFAPMEMVWKLRKGASVAAPEHRSRFKDAYVGVRKISLRAQDSIFRWDIADNGDIKGLWQQPFTGPQVYIPAERYVLFRTRSNKNNPEGRSILRNAYRPWFFKSRLEEIEGIGVERDLAGLPIMRVPGRLFEGQASPEEKAVYQSYLSLVQNIKRDKQEGVLLPGTRDDKGNYHYDLSLLSTGGTRQLDTSKIIDRYDQRIAMSVMADFLFLGQSNHGSLALSSDKTEMFATAIGTMMDTVVDTFNAHIMPRLWEVNGFDYETLPKLGHGDIEKPDLEKLSRFLTAMTGIGVPLMPDRDLENKLRRFASLPEAPEYEEGEMDPRVMALKDQEQFLMALDALQSTELSGLGLNGGPGGPAGGPPGSGGEAIMPDNMPAESGLEEKPKPKKKEG